MDCSTARTTLGPDFGPVRDSPEAQEAFAHQAACPACQAHFANQRDLVARLRQLADLQRAPTELRTRILSALADEGAGMPTPVVPRRPGRFYHRRWLWGAGAAAAAATLVFFASLGRDPTPGHRYTAGSLVSVAVETGPPMEILASRDPAPLREWFASRLGPSFEIPDIPDADLVGGKIIYVDGVKSAAVQYRVNGLELTYFMVPGTSLLERIGDPQEIVSLSAQGYEVAVWSEGETARAVVAALDRPTLTAIAEHCRNMRVI